MTLKKGLVFTIATALIVAGMADIAAAQARGRGRGQSKAHSQENGSVTVVFRDNDRATFHNYFVTHKIAPQALPPGIAKNIARGKPLPPGIAKRAFPAELVAMVPRQRGVTFYVVGDRVVAVRRGTVIDIILDVFQ
jgi:hypothetical protein